MTHDPYSFHFSFGIFPIPEGMKENIILKDKYYCLLLALLECV